MGSVNNMGRGGKRRIRTMWGTKKAKASEGKGGK
jgi:hypothetical protein